MFYKLKKVFAGQIKVLGAGRMWPAGRTLPRPDLEDKDTLNYVLSNNISYIPINSHKFGFNNYSIGH